MSKTYFFSQSKFPKSTGAQQKAASCLSPVSWQLLALWPDLKSNRPEPKEQTSRKSSGKQPRNQAASFPSYVHEWQELQEAS